MKSECDICCTSSNAIKIVKSLNAPEVLFLPDTYLGKWVEGQLGNVKVTTYPGYCPTHLRIKPEDTEIMKFAVESDAKQFIIATEKGVVDRLQRDYPEKEFILIKSNIICQNMKWNTLEDIYNSLKYEQYEINVDKNIAQKAIKCIDKMLEVSK